MVNEPLGTLEEFFDFAQLERDNEEPPQHQDSVHLDPAPPFPDQSSVMEWQYSKLGDQIHTLDAVPSRPASDQFGEIMDAQEYAGFAQPILMSQHIHDYSLPSESNDPLIHEPVLSWHGNISGALETGRFRPSSSLNPKQRLPGKARLSGGQSSLPVAPTRKPASAKRKGPPSRIPPEARQILEDEFASNPYPCSWEIDIIAHQANLDTKRVRNWFNNSRARKKTSG